MFFLKRKAVKILISGNMYQKIKLNNKINDIIRHIRDVYHNIMFIKAILVGFVSAVVDLSLLFVLTDILLWNYWISANIAFVIAVFVNFSLQKFWTFNGFGSTRAHTQMFKFFSNALLNLVVNSILMYVFVSIFGIWYLLAQAIITLLLFLFNFAVYRYYVFI